LTWKTVSREAAKNAEKFKDLGQFDGNQIGAGWFLKTNRIYFAFFAPSRE